MRLNSITKGLAAIVLGSSLILGCQKEPQVKTHAEEYHKEDYTVDLNRMKSNLFELKDIISNYPIVIKEINVEVDNTVVKVSFNKDISDKFSIVTGNTFVEVGLDGVEQVSRNFVEYKDHELYSKALYRADKSLSAALSLLKTNKTVMYRDVNTDLGFK